uniref:Zinc finger, CCHC-type n=1 Tax=Tanacetum cinerariifolium TaxID=118510 RepID=A0A699H2G0_TANCI|nr:zinc finger, CCHC-type [Tanacetum cinerariifolium]
MAKWDNDDYVCKGLILKVSINFITELRDVIFDKNIFSSIPRPSLSIPKRTKDIGGLVVPKKVTEEVVQQPEPELRKTKKNKTPKDVRPEFQLYLIKGTMDEDVALWKESINDEMDSIMGDNTWVLDDLPLVHNLIIHQMDVKTAFLNGELDKEVYMNQHQGFIMSGNENKVCKLIKSLHGLKRAPKRWHQKFDEVVLSKVSTSMDTSEKLMPNNGQAVSQLEYSRVIGCLISRMEKVGKHLNKEIQIMDMNKGKEKMVIEIATFNESSDYNPFQATSDERFDDTLKSSSEDTCGSDSTWKQKNASKAVKTWQQILNKEFGINKSKEDVGGSSDVRREGQGCRVCVGESEEWSWEVVGGGGVAEKLGKVGVTG